MKNKAKEILDGLIRRYPVLDGQKQAIADAAGLLSKAFADGRKLLCCGNGGSASDSLHIVGELMKQFVAPRRLSEDIENKLKEFDDGEYIVNHLQGALPAIALVGSAAIESAFANDCAPDLVFAQQVLGLGKENDILLGISTSGNSKNVILAVETAKAKGMKVIAMTGKGGGKLARYANILIDVPEMETYKIQELHLPVYHAICMMVESDFYVK